MTSRHLGDKVHREGDRTFTLEFFEDGGKIIAEVHIQKLEASGLDPCALEKVGEVEGATKEECLKKAISWCREWARK
jgi:hypothetical protein